MRKQVYTILNSPNAMIVVGLVFCNAWTFSVWGYRKNDPNFVTLITVIVVIASMLVWILRIKCGVYGLLIYFLVFLELNGVALGKTYIGLYGVEASLEKIERNYFVFTTNNTDRLRKINKWLGPKHPQILFNEPMKFNRSAISLMYANVLNKVRSMSNSTFVVLFEDDAKPMCKGWEHMLDVIVQNALNTKIDLVYLDHRSYLTSMLLPIVKITGTVGVLYRVESLKNVSDYLRAYDKTKLDMYDYIISEGCYAKKFICDTYPLFRETGDHSLLRNIT